MNFCNKDKMYHVEKRLHIVHNISLQEASLYHISFLKHDLDASHVSLHNLKKKVFLYILIIK